MNNKNNFYIASFQSLYLAMIGIGVNSGIIISFISKYINLYLSNRFDVVIDINTYSNEYNQSLDFVPAIGVVFNIGDVKLFTEFIVSLPVLSNTDNYIYSERLYSLQLGMSF